MRENIIKINEDTPEVGHQALDNEDIYVNHTSEYTCTALRHMHLTHEIHLHDIMDEILMFIFTVQG